MLAIFSSSAFKSVSGVANIAAGATIEVRRERDNGLADIYSDAAGTARIANPSAFADANGRFSFYAAGLIDGGYSVKATSGSYTDTLRNQPIGTAKCADATAFGRELISEIEDTPALIARLGYTERFAKLEQIERLLRRARTFSGRGVLGLR